MKSSLTEVKAIEVANNMWAVSSPNKIRISTRCPKSLNHGQSEIPAFTIRVVNLTEPGMSGCWMTTDGEDPIELRAKKFIPSLPRGDFYHHLQADVGLPSSMVNSWASSPDGSSFDEVSYNQSTLKKFALIQAYIGLSFVAFASLTFGMVFYYMKYKKVNFQN